MRTLLCSVVLVIMGMLIGQNMGVSDVIAHSEDKSKSTAFECTFQNDTLNVAYSITNVEDPQLKRITELLLKGFLETLSDNLNLSGVLPFRAHANVAKHMIRATTENKMLRVRPPQQQDKHSADDEPMSY